MNIETVAIDTLRPHPRNYQKHPEAQLTHIAASITQHGIYRAIVTASDGTILAGHGVVDACRSLGMATVPIVRLNVGPDDPAAIKVMIADNEISNGADVDDRALTELLRDLSLNDDLAGTGFDAEQLAALLMVTRPESEIADKADAAEWLGMPEYEEGSNLLKLVITFRNEADREQFITNNALQIKKKIGRTWASWWPDKPDDDAAAVRYETVDE